MDSQFGNAWAGDAVEGALDAGAAARRVVFALLVAAAVALMAGSLVGCTSPERSRALDDEKLSAKTIALQVCSNCHGTTGVSTSPNFPMLAAQPQTYLVAQLKAFKAHGRSDPAGFEYMWGLSARLSDSQIEGLATYYASQPAAPGRGGKAAALGEGRKIFEEGIPARSIPACTACHGAKGEGNGQFPRLAGQHADYVAKQLNVFARTDARPGGAMMKAVAHDLSKDNIADVAHYLESM
jgi:cytochrome c553